MNNDNDEMSNFSTNGTFAEVVNARATRRGFLAGSLGVAALTFVGGTSNQAIAAPAGNRGRSNLIAFTSIPMDNGPMPKIAPEYEMSVIIPWREKLDGSGTSYPYGLSAADQEKSIGLGHDGMWFFGDDKKGVLCINQEFGTNQHAFGLRDPRNLEDVRLSQALHGVSVVALAKAGNTWKVQNDRRNRRIHVNTPVEFSGPVAGSAQIRTVIGNDNPKGTVNNCSMGHTPWGTYLTCEENFHMYFGANGTWDRTADQASKHERYGISAAGGGYGWHTYDDRFDLAANANEENRFGWVVEIDPNDPTKKPVKRTALGRLKHEGATVVEGQAGKVVVYTGDDERNEYIYKYVSDRNWKLMRAHGQDPLDEGTLYVAKFKEDGTGEWLELSPKNPKLADWSLEDILIHTRSAADVAGATKMDRPEWITVGEKQEVFCTLTNNTSPDPDRGPGNPPGTNPNGHIVKWVDSKFHTGTTFEWDFFAIAAEVSDENGQMFGSPDGIWADQKGRVFVETDGSQPGGNNDQLLVANQKTAEFKRLLTGVRGGEVTGITVTPSQRTMFVNIQHPGNGNPELSNFPDDFTGGGGQIPRDATIVITRKDGGIIGS